MAVRGVRESIAMALSWTKNDRKDDVRLGVSGLGNFDYALTSANRPSYRLRTDLTPEQSAECNQLERSLGWSVWSTTIGTVASVGAGGYWMDQEKMEPDFIGPPPQETVAHGTMGMVIASLTTIMVSLGLALRYNRMYTQQCMVEVPRVSPIQLTSIRRAEALDEQLMESAGNAAGAMSILGVLSAVIPQLRVAYAALISGISDPSRMEQIKPGT